MLFNFKLNVVKNDFDIHYLSHYEINNEERNFLNKILEDIYIDINLNINYILNNNLVPMLKLIIHKNNDVNWLNPDEERGFFIRFVTQKNNKKYCTVASLLDYSISEVEFEKILWSYLENVIKSKFFNFIKIHNDANEKIINLLKRDDISLIKDIRTHYLYTIMGVFKTVILNDIVSEHPSHAITLNKESKIDDFINKLLDNKEKEVAMYVPNEEKNGYYLKVYKILNDNVVLKRNREAFSDFSSDLTSSFFSSACLIIDTPSPVKISGGSDLYQRTGVFFSQGNFKAIPIEIMNETYNFDLDNGKKANNLIYKLWK
jgi:hypothetical protein